MNSRTPASLRFRLQVPIVLLMTIVLMLLVLSYGGVKAASTSTPTIKTTLSSGTIIVGESVTDSAVLTFQDPKAAGFVIFYYFYGASCSPDLSQGKVVGNTTITNGSPTTFTSATVVLENAGPYSWEAIYSGDSNDSPATSQCELLTVDKSSPSLSISLDSRQISVGGSDSAEANITGLSPKPGGHVEYKYFTGSNCGGARVFSVYNASVTVSGPVPTASQQFTSAGLYQWEAVYSGDSNNNNATSTCQQLTVIKRPLSMAVLLTPATMTVGSSVQAKAIISDPSSRRTPQAGGTVTYYFFPGKVCSPSGAQQIGVPVTVTNGVVPYSASQQFNASGVYQLEALYTGDANDFGNTACATLLVRMSSPMVSLFISPSAAVLEQLTNVTATLRGGFHANGAMTFYYVSPHSSLGCEQAKKNNGGIAFPSSPLRNGVAFHIQRLNSTGPYLFYARYGGDSNNNIEYSDCGILTINKPGVSISTTISVFYGFVVNGSATLNGVTGTAGGTVTYEYFSGSGCQPPGTIVSHPVVVTNGSVPSSASTYLDSPGKHSWIANYSGDANNLQATSPCEPFTVSLNLVATSVTVSCSPLSVVVGSRVACMAKVFTVAGSAPEGKVSWSQNGTGKFTPSSCTLHNAVCGAILRPNSTAASSVLITANYNGSPLKLPSYGSFSLKVTPHNSRITVSCLPTSASVAKSAIVTCTARVFGYGRPTGSVTWTQQSSNGGFVTFSTSTCILSLTKGTCSVTLTGTLVGQVTISGRYAGDLNNNDSSSSLKQGQVSIRK